MAGPSSSRLFEPLPLTKNVTLSNRIVMAPLTRFRATDSFVPTPLQAQYYAQRASYPGTLLISEATFITARAGGFNNVPGIWNQDQIEGWKKVTAAVHAKGSYIFLQLWALGRAANYDNLQKHGPFPLVSSSATPLDGGPRVSEGSPMPHPLTKDEIKGWVADYAQAAKNAVAAGFDGVELHAANGYLIDQFTQDTCNTRTDEYGGSIENRGRFCLEVASAVVDAVGAEKVGIRLSPFSTFQGMKMRDDLIVPQFSYILENLKHMGLAYVHVVESRISGNADVEATEKIDFVFRALGKSTPVLIAGGFTPDSARRAADEEYADYDIGIVFGRYFISTPDLVYRIKNGLELTKYDRTTFYNAQSEVGYIDYPFSPEWEAEFKATSTETQASL